MKVLDIILICLAVMLVATIIIAARIKEPEPFTELYFTEHTTLPRLGDQAHFLFTINNLENQDMQYHVKLYADGHNRTEKLEEFLVNIGKGTRKTFNVSYSLPDDFGTGKVRVQLVNKDQSIHYWTRYAKELREYDGNLVPSDCVPRVNSTTGNVSIKLTGEYWPRVQVFNEQELLLNVSLNGTARFNFTNISGIFEVQMPKDYYQENVDTNLFLEWVKVDSQYYEEMLVDKGNNAFDCDDVHEGDALYSTGSFRIDVGLITE